MATQTIAKSQQSPEADLGTQWPDIRQRARSATSDKQSTTSDITARDDTNDDDTNGSPTSTNEQEKALLRKLDWRIVPWIFILYFLSVEDRANVGYAMTMNKQEGHDLATTAGLTGQENNIGLGLFYVAYIVSTSFLLWMDVCTQLLFVSKRCSRSHPT